MRGWNKSIHWDKLIQVRKIFMFGMNCLQTYWQTKTSALDFWIWIQEQCCLANKTMNDIEKQAEEITMN